LRPKIFDPGEKTDKLTFDKGARRGFEKAKNRADTIWAKDNFRATSGIDKSITETRTGGSRKRIVD
jgi:hypothetical protein